MATIAIVAMGEMGAGLAARFTARGATVLTSLAGPSSTSGDRAREAGAEPVDDAELAVRAQAILSVLPPARAGDLAERFRPLIADAADPPDFVDCNAIAPQTLCEIARSFAEEGLPFVDGGIIGGPPKGQKIGPKIYLSGAVERTAALFGGHGLDVRIVSEQLGDASALKMSYAGFTKGFQALATAMALGARRNGVMEPLVEELSQSQPELYGWLCRQLPKMPAKAYRWDGEMQEISRFLEPEEGAMAMFSGAADLYRRVAADREADSEGEFETMLDGFARSAT